jgi:hypothetical protein
MGRSLLTGTKVSSHTEQTHTNDNRFKIETLHALLKLLKLAVHHTKRLDVHFALWYAAFSSVYVPCVCVQEPLVYSA